MRNITGMIIYGTMKVPGREPVQESLCLLQIWRGTGFYRKNGRLSDRRTVSSQERVRFPLDTAYRTVHHDDYHQLWLFFTSCTCWEFGYGIITSEGLQSHTIETASDAAVIITVNFPVQRFDFDVFTQRTFRIRTTALITAIRDVRIQAVAGCDAVCSGYRLLRNLWHEEC